VRASPKIEPETFSFHTHGLIEVFHLDRERERQKEEEEKKVVGSGVVLLSCPKS